MILVIHKDVSELNISGVRQMIVSQDSRVLFGFVTEITNVKVKREKRNRERTKLVEEKRTRTQSFFPWTAH